MFAATRQEALQQLGDFIPSAGSYSRDRNHVFPYDHHNVSCLSAAIRHRLITENEAAAAPLARYAESTIEKYTQEIYWRRYWKSWLSLRPQVWTDYVSELALLNEIDSETQHRINTVCAGSSGLEIMDYFTRELIETGYLHNHARMWWAAWWVHVERLPWQLGAAFFYKHLLDGDPASNTLSWRWVAGLQTPGKTYLPRRSNLEKYLSSALICQFSKGLELLEKPQAFLPNTLLGKPEITQPNVSQTEYDPSLKTLLLIHEDDLSPEASSLKDLKPDLLLVVADRSTWQDLDFTENKVSWLNEALADAHQRAARAFPEATMHSEVLTLRANSLAVFFDEHNITQIVMMRPDIGYLQTRLIEMFEYIGNQKINIHYIDREEDLQIRSLATAGFFGFWKNLIASGVLPKKVPK